MMFPGSHMPDRTLRERRERDAAFKAWAASEAERIRRQRVYLTALDGPLKNGLVARMLDRAWELLDCGEAEAADAILEFVPADQAERLLQEFFE